MMLFFVLVFVPRLARTKRTGLSEYGALAQRYAREFDQRLRGCLTTGFGLRFNPRFRARSQQVEQERVRRPPSCEVKSL